MTDVEALLKGLDTTLRNSFEHAVVWEQRDNDLVGKYVYVKCDGEELGVFIGYLVDSSNSVRACITFLFAHPASASKEMSAVRRVLHKLLVRFNLRLKEQPYKLVSSKFPALIRIRYPNEHIYNAGDTHDFFSESIALLRTCEPVYKALTV